MLSLVTLNGDFDEPWIVRFDLSSSQSSPQVTMLEDLIERVDVFGIGAVQSIARLLQLVVSIDYIRLVVI